MSVTTNIATDTTQKQNPSADRSGQKATNRRPRSRDEDADLLEALRDGDCRAFRDLVNRHNSSMIRIARGFVRDEEVACEVVQETWMVVLNGLERFRGESALKTWIFRILMNKARRTAKREARTIAFSAMRSAENEGDTDPADWFADEGRWTSPVHGWRFVDPESQSINRQGVELLDAALELLPSSQRAVVTMRDVEGRDTDEICEALGISSVNQRVLLHRGRARLRKALAPAA